MFRIAYVFSVCCFLFHDLQPVNGQPPNAELKALKKENEKLRNEIEEMKRTWRPPPMRKDGKASATVENVEFFIDKTTRISDAVIVEIIATSRRGDRSLPIGKLHAVDNDGNVYKIERGSVHLEKDKLPEGAVILRDGVMTRFAVTIPKVAANAKEFQQIAIVADAVDVLNPSGLPRLKEEIKLNNVRIGK